jgi:hypothetical protein
MFVSLAAVTLAVQLGSPVPTPSPGEAFVLQTQYRVYAHPPPCGDGWDLSARDGLCYPNGYLAPQDQAARQYPGPVYRRADTPYRAATAPTSIFGMAYVTPTARCHPDFNRAGSIAVPNMTKTTIPSAGQGVDTIKYRGSFRKQDQKRADT